MPQATQVVVVASHDAPGMQPTIRQLSPAFPLAMHIEPSGLVKQDPVTQ